MIRKLINIAFYFSKLKNMFQYCNVHIFGCLFNTKWRASLIKLAIQHLYAENKHVTSASPNYWVLYHIAKVEPSLPLGYLKTVNRLPSAHICKINVTIKILNAFQLETRCPKLDSETKQTHLHTGCCLTH